MKRFWPLLYVSFFAFSCADEAKPDRAKKPSASGVYANYQVWAEEGKDEVTIRLQYRSGNSEGPAFAVQKPGSVLLDGEELSTDSTLFNGVFYELAKPVDAFNGEHAIVLKGMDGKEQKEIFTYVPFTIANELPLNIKKEPFAISLEGLPEGSSPVRLVMIDTDYDSPDVNEVVLVEEGKLEITADHLSNLTNGPVVLEIHKEEERPLARGLIENGSFMLNYILKRQFTLVE